MLVEVSSKGVSIDLKWSPPDILENDHITGYEVSLTAEEEKRVVNYLLSSDGREVTFEGLKTLTVYKVELMVKINSSSSGILQPFYSANLTTVEESNTEAIVNGVGGAGVTLAVVVVVIAIVVGGVLLGCCVEVESVSKDKMRVRKLEREGEGEIEEVSEGRGREGVRGRGSEGGREDGEEGRGEREDGEKEVEK